MSNLDVEMAEVIVNLTKENENLKNELVKECKEHQEAMQIAGERIKELKNENAELSKIIESLKQQLKTLQEKYEDRKQFCIREVQTLLNIINSLLYDNSQEQLKDLQEKEKSFGRGEEE